MANNLGIASPLARRKKPKKPKSVAVATNEVMSAPKQEVFMRLKSGQPGHVYRWVGVRYPGEDWRTVILRAEDEVQAANPKDGRILVTEITSLPLIWPE